METLLREEKNQLTMKMAALKKLAAAQKTQLTHLVSWFLRNHVEKNLTILFLQSDCSEALEAAVSKLQEENQQTVAALEREKTALKDLQKSFFELRVRMFFCECLAKINFLFFRRGETRRRRRAENWRKS